MADLGRIGSPLPHKEVFVTLDWSNIWSVTGQTLGQIDSPLPLAEVFVTLDWSYMWSVTGRTYGWSRKRKGKIHTMIVPPINAT